MPMAATFLSPTSRARDFENKIATILADAIGAQLTYYWRPALERGMTRAVFDDNVCDILMDVPARTESLLTTLPLYRTTYVLAYRIDKASRRSNHSMIRGSRR